MTKPTPAPAAQQAPAPEPLSRPEPTTDARPALISGGAGAVASRRYLSVAEFAALTQMKPDTVRWQLHNGRLRGRRKGSRWQVLASELTRRGEVN